MSFEPKPLSFIFSKNEKKTEEKHPDITGSLIDENGKKWKLAGWTKEKDGRKFVTGNLSEFKEFDKPTVANNTKDDLPF